MICWAVQSVALTRNPHAIPAMSPEVERYTLSKDQDNVTSKPAAPPPRLAPVDLLPPFKKSASPSKPQFDHKTTAPDGGWGWMVVLGVALANMTTQSLVSTFGLLFGDALHSMGQETTGAALIMNVMSAITNLSGLITGPVIKRFSYRKVALVGGVLFSGGIFLASMATNMTHLFISYSLLSGLGLGLTGPASFVALSTYFSSRRGRAVGLALVGTGVGQMLMPQAVGALLDSYGFQGAMLLIGGMSLHAIVGATLYQPIKRHRKHPENLLIPSVIDQSTKPNLTSSLQAPSSMKSVPQLQASDCSTPSATLLNPPEIHDDAMRRLSKAEIGHNRDIDVYAAEYLDEHEMDNVKIEKPNEKRTRKLRGLLCSCWGGVVETMDLHLFQDAVFVNITIGIAIFNVSNINFSMIFPFFLSSLGYSRADVALCMSVTAAADIVSRLVVPSVTDHVKVGSRTTLLGAMIVLAFCRSLLAEQTSFPQMIAVSVLCGFVRGAAILNLNLSIAEHCGNEKLPAALGINMVLKGIAILGLGPFLGWLRDATGSFPICLHAQSILLLLTALSWVLEYFMIWRRARRENANDSSA